MRKFGLFTALAMTFLCGGYAADQTTEEGELTKEDIKQLSEAFGHFIGRNLDSPGVEFDVEAVIKGLRDSIAGREAPMSDEDYQQKMALLQSQAFRKLAEENLDKATAFFKTNKNETNVVEVEEGKLQYKIMEPGTGTVVQENASPQINYTGTFLDGSKFGGSEDTGGPVTIPLDKTIPGFSKGIVGMREGEKRRIFVHPDLGYGSQGPLPPNATLILDVEVVSADTAEEKAE